MLYSVSYESVVLPGKADTCSSESDQMGKNWEMPTQDKSSLGSSKAVNVA